MTSLFGHFLPKNDQMTQNNALYSNKQNVPKVAVDRVDSEADAGCILCILSHMRSYIGLGE